MTEDRADGFVYNTRKVDRLLRQRLPNDFVERGRAIETWLEDVDIQLEAAKRSAVKRHYASAKAELRGAIMILDEMEKQDEC